MFYDRKIKYFDYIENGQRLRNGGFVKLEVRDDACSVTMQISGLQMIENRNCKVYLLSGEKQELLCEIPVRQGRGSMQRNVNSRNMCGEISYEQLEEIKIPIATGRELRCGIAEKTLNQELVAQKSERREEAIAGYGKEEIGEESRTGYREEEIGEEPIAGYGEEQIREEQETEHRSEQIPERNNKSEIVQKLENHKAVPLLDDKWKQLSAIYSHINPFQDEREYLSIGPGDFVILPQKYYRLVHNSFLLHGFYNYKHLILTCMENRGEKCYYIGVPGNFYEREKQVALMFGFESFECREEPAVAGDFGYYMIRVEL